MLYVGKSRARDQSGPRISIKLILAGIITVALNIAGTGCSSFGGMAEICIGFDMGKPVSVKVDTSSVSVDIGRGDGGDSPTE